MIQGSESLLAIEQVLLWARTAVRSNAFDETAFKLDIAASIHGHYCANGKTAGDTCQQVPDPRVVPNPAALEVRELNLTFLDFVEKVF